MHKAREIPKKNLSGEVEKELTGRETEAWEIRFCELRAVVEELGGEQTLVARFPAIVICGAALMPIASTGSLRRIFEGFRRSGETIREPYALGIGTLIVVDETSTNTEAALDSLGSSVNLYWVSPGCFVGRLSRKHSGRLK